jgi:hypothetical protein
MSSYLANLVSRSLRPSDSVQPLLRPLFAPPAPGGDGLLVSPHTEKPEWDVITSPRDSEAKHSERKRHLPKKASPRPEGGDATSLAVPPVEKPQAHDEVPLIEPLRHMGPSMLEPLPEPRANDKVGSEGAANSAVPVIPSVPQVRAANKVTVKEVKNLGQTERSAAASEPEPTAPLPGREMPSLARNREMAANRPRQTVDHTDRVELRVSASREELKPASAEHGAMRRHYPIDQARIQADQSQVRPLQSFRDLSAPRVSSRNESDGSATFAGPRRIFSRHTPIDVPVKLAAPAIPNIEVTIGRIEVRASASTPPATPARPTAPVVGLEEYLRRRSERSSG